MVDFEINAALQFSAGRKSNVVSIFWLGLFVWMCLNTFTINVLAVVAQVRFECTLVALMHLFFEMQQTRNGKRLKWFRNA